MTVGRRAPVPIDVAYPFTGTWLARNSPANRVPSHGTTAFATAHAIDFVPVDPSGRSAPMTLKSLLRPQPPESFPGFGQLLLAPVHGVVIAVHDQQPDHEAHRGWPSLGYALGQRRRLARGWQAVAGNHVLIDAGNAIVALCHLQFGSISLRPGATIRTGERIGRCGNSGNSTEPHVHLQAMTGPDPANAAPVPITFDGALPRSGEIVITGASDPRRNEAAG